MNYELAKRLCEAGFPQGGKGSWVGPTDQIVWRSGDRVYVPTLEELIEACGESFERMGIENGSWYAIAVRGNIQYSRSHFSTPTEAVAKLYLVLQGVQ
jgi:hypothetical protein